MSNCQRRHLIVPTRHWLAGVLFGGLAVCTCVAGCHRLPSLGFRPLAGLQPNGGFPPLAPPPPPPIEVPVANPTQIPLVDPTFLWNQVVDAVDDHFRIDDEQPLRRMNADWLEGKLITYPEVSGTVLEPWRSDAARGFERLQSTFLTVRRTCTVRVMNEETGYTLDIVVLKEQEDVDQSQFSTAGAAAQTTSGAIVRNENQMRQMPITLGWYEIGRDRELEQRLMANILGRISNVEQPHGLLKHRRQP